MRISDYPFTEDAAEQVRQAGYSLESLLGKTSFKTVRGRAAERVAEAISGTISESRPIRRQSFWLSCSPILWPELWSPVWVIPFSCAAMLWPRQSWPIDGCRMRKRLTTHGRRPGASSSGTGALQDSLYRIYSGGTPHAQPEMEADEPRSLQGYLTVTDEELKRIMEEAVREKVLKGLPLPVDEKICAHLCRNTWGR